MIIDFHAHVFPDALAPKAKKSLTESINNLYEPVTDLTVGGLLERMDEWGIDISVTQPVITKLSQLKTTNEWAAGTASDRIVPFGGIFPHTDDYKRDIDFAASFGFRGLKFHPEYQDFIVDAPEMLEIYDYALSKGLILLFHAGADPAFKAPFRSSPAQFAHILDEMKGGVIVAAHFGGQSMWDEVLNVLAGRDIYLDTSMGFEYFTEKQFLDILSAHGSEKILFASDSPWSNTGRELEHLRSMPITDAQKENILCCNAQRILGL